MLDTVALLCALPPLMSTVGNPLGCYFEAARGSEDIRPLEMAKSSGTNYHYVVPEISDEIRFAIHSEAVPADLAEARYAEVPAWPVVIGPASPSSRWPRRPPCERAVGAN